MTHPRPRRLARAATVLATLGLLAGCGGTGDGQAARPPATLTQRPSPAAEPPAPASPSTESPAPESPAPEPTTTRAPATPEPAPATATSAPQPSAPSPVAPAAPAVLGAGDSGPEVLALQQRLTGLGYWLGTPDGTYGGLTTQAVLALQGAAGLHRDGRVGPATQQALDAGTRPKARSSSGRVTEIDRDRGLVLFAQDGVVRRVLHTSTGTFKKYTHEGRTMLADTPDGHFTQTWAQDGWREGELGRLYRPRYFHPDGIAVHGYPSVPAYPASHGCARVTLPAMDMIWAEDLMPKGSAVWVY